MFPSILTAFTYPNATDRLNSPSHSSVHGQIASNLGQVQAIIGRSGDNSVLGTIIGDLRSPGSSGGGHVQGAAFGGTGQTTFTKGNLLVAQSASVLSKLAVGSDNQILVADSSTNLGVKWGASIGTPTIRTYTTASILAWVKPSTLSYIVVEVVGGGGGGGGSSANNSSTGGGGGGGGYSKKIYLASVLGSTEIVQIGSVGAAGTSTGNGGNGGYSSFSISSTSIIGAGGAGGSVSDGATGAGGEGGFGSGGTINIAGGRGSNGPGGTAGVVGGDGGDSMFGHGGGAVGPGNEGGASGSGYGSGGSGGRRSNASQTGGPGTVGAVFIYEY